MISSKTKSGLLIAAHFIGHFAVAWAVYWESIPAAVGLFALVLADAGLLGIWGAFGSTRPLWRLLVVLAATAYLCALIFIVFKTDDVNDLVLIFLIVALPMTVILLVLSGFRHSRRRLQFGQWVPSSSASEGFQFSIRQLLIATAVAAGLLALSRGLGHLPNTGDGWQITLIFAVAGPYIILVELATIWGSLGIGRPFPRLLVVLPTAFVVGMMPPFFLNTPRLEGLLGLVELHGAAGHDPGRLATRRQVLRLAAGEWGQGRATGIPADTTWLLTRANGYFMKK